MTELYYEVLGKFIRSARKEKGIRQSDLAYRIGLSRPSVVNMEAGRQAVSLPMFMAICDALDVHPVEAFAASVGEQWTRVPDGPTELSWRERWDKERRRNRALSGRLQQIISVLKRIDTALLLDMEAPVDD